MNNAERVVELLTALSAYVGKDSAKVVFLSFGGHNTKLRGWVAELGGVHGEGTGPREALEALVASLVTGARDESQRALAGLDALETVAPR